jgi:Tfp pilus assembly protein PilF
MYRTKFILKTKDYLIIAIVAVAAYFPTFTGDFILDDNILVKNNPYIKEAHSIYSYFSQEDGIVDQMDLGVYHTGYYRPLINITYFLDYKIWGMNAYGFRITNLIFHLLNCFIIFRLIDYFIRDQRTALLCAVLFSIHPVNTEAVSCIVARNNILVSLFSLSSLYFYIISVDRRDNLKIFISIIAFFCAVFTKEFGLMILPVFFLYHRFLALNKRSILSEFINYVPFIIIVIFYFYLRHLVIGNILTPFDDSQILKSIYFVPYLIIWNLKIIFLPYGFHQYSISYPSSFLDFYAILSFISILPIIVFLWKMRNKRILIFSSISFLIVIFPVLGIIPSASTPNTLISLRWLYFPLFFVILGLAWIIKQSFDVKQILVKAILYIAICYFGIYSFVLNKYHWHDQGTFLTQEVLHFNNILHAGGLAEYLFSQGKLSEAEKYFNMAINHYPDTAYNYINYSALLISKREYLEALSFLDKAGNLLMTNHEHGEWFNNRGSALLGLGDRIEAIEHLNRAVTLVPDEAIFWANLGGAYGMIGDYEQSMNALKRGIDLSRDLIETRINLAITYMHLNDFKNALLVLEEISEKEREENQNVRVLIEMARKGLNH